ncbi:hypothetical protein EYR38_000266 [Pleurotus pulmonarius]|nr:hypothetical protein EYR38_000266 [Pleurotus pulmonarius]
MLARHWFDTKKNTSKLLLRNIYIDATKSEQQRSQAHPLAKQGLPYPLAPGSKVKRGPRFAQGLVYPPMACSIPDAAFRLVGVHFNPRNVLLQFNSSSLHEETAGQWWMQVQMLTHTVLQVYDADQWGRASQKLTNDHCTQKRGFKIGMALDFGDYVMAFLTMDNLFRVFYARNRETLPAPLFDIYNDFKESLKLIIDWAESRANDDRSGLAAEAIRKAAGTFVGIGVYTISEIMHRAGLLPILTEKEVFDNPSQFARLIEAFYCHAARAHEEVWALVKPFLRSNFFIAVQNEDRLLYTKWLAVHGKDRTWISKRLRIQYEDLLAWLAKASQLSEPLIRSEDNGFFDLVEPTLLRAGLEKDTNLGIETTKPTYLHSSMASFTPLYLPAKSLQGSWVEPSLYYTSDKPLWSIVPQLPSNTFPAGFSTETCKGKRKAKGPPQVSPAPREEKQRQLFEYIVNFMIDYAHIQKGKQKVANPKAFKRKKEVEEENLPPTEPNPARRRRLSADKRLALGLLVQETTMETQ